MNRVIIIGAGELGSRHLQGIVRSSRPLEITCIDLFESALIRARKRLEEIEQIVASLFRELREHRAGIK